MLLLQAAPMPPPLINFAQFDGAGLPVQCSLHGVMAWEQQQQGLLWCLLTTPAAGRNTAPLWFRRLKKCVDERLLLCMS
jgi:hypothetical protein